MKKLINLLKRIIFRKKYKIKEINELLPGDMFWAKLKEYKGSKIPKGHIIRSFMFVKFDGLFIHCLFNTTKKNSIYVQDLCKDKFFYINHNEILKINYKTFINKSNYYISKEALNEIIGRLIKKYDFLEYKDLFIKYTNLIKKGNIVSTKDKRYIVIRNKLNSFIGCVIYKKYNWELTKLGDGKCIDGKLVEISKKDIIKISKGLNESELQKLNLLFLVKDYNKKTYKYKKKKEFENIIGDVIMISNTKYVIIDIYKDHYFIVDEYKNHEFFKIKAKPINSILKYDYNYVSFLSNRSLYMRGNIVNDSVEVKEYIYEDINNLKWVN